MRKSVYDIEARVEADHWWFVGRRRLLADRIRRFGLSPTAPILDVGSGTGANLRLFRDMGFTQVVGLDVSPDAVRYCEAKGLGPVETGDILHLPFDDGSFDLIIAADVIEHIDDHVAAAKEIARVMAPDGRAVFTAPAFKSLWGRQDIVSEHHRRYRRPELVKLIDGVGLTVIDSFYFNYLLFGPIWLARQIMRLAGIKVDSENQLNPRGINALLKAVFQLDLATAPIIRAPFGVSILVEAVKTESGERR